MQQSRLSMVSVGVILVMVVLYWHDNIAVTQQVNCSQAAPVLDHMEITQVIQHDPCDTEVGCGGSGPPTGSSLINLVDGKITTVRLYIKSSPLGCSLSGVDASLEVKEDGANIFGKTLLPYNGPIDIASDVPDWDREDDDSTLNFVFLTPPSEEHDKRELQFVGCVGFASVGQVSCESPVVEAREFFRATSPPRVVAIPVVIVDELENRSVPDVSILRAVDAYKLHRGIYPYPDIYSGGGYTLSAHREIEYLDSDGTLSDSDTNELFDKIFKHRALSLVPPIPPGASREINPFEHAIDNNTIVVAWVPNGSMSSNGKTHFSIPPPFPVEISGNIIAEANPEGAQHRWVLAHELGHVYLNDIGDDSNVPINIVGWDSARRAEDAELVRLPELNDVMSAPLAAATPIPVPANTVWIMESNYESARDPFLGVQAGQLMASTPEPYQRVFGAVTEPNTVTLQSVELIEGYHEGFEGYSGGAELQLADISGSLLYTITLEPTDLIIGVPVPEISTTHRVMLWKNGQLLSDLQRSQTAPTLTISAPLPNTVITDVLTVSGTFGDADGDDLEISLLYRSSTSEEWKSLRAGMSELDVAVAMDATPKTYSAEIKIIVSDGFNSASQSVSGLKVLDDKAPVVMIANPPPGETRRSGSMVNLLAYMADPEDPGCGGCVVTWTSSIDGVLGIGQLINTTELSTGAHVLTASVTDAASNVTTDTVDISIAP